MVLNRCNGSAELLVIHHLKPLTAGLCVAGNRFFEAAFQLGGALGDKAGQIDSAAAFLRFRFAGFIGGRDQHDGPLKVIVRWRLFFFVNAVFSWQILQQVIQQTLNGRTATAERPLLTQCVEAFNRLLAQFQADPAALVVYRFSQWRIT